MDRHLRYHATRVTIVRHMNYQNLLTNARLDGSVPRQPSIRNQVITLPGIYARRDIFVLGEVKHLNNVQLELFSTQLETGMRMLYFRSILRNVGS